jgi:hypothetical protein
MTRTVRILQRWLVLDASGYAGVSGRARQCFAERVHIPRGAERLVGIVGGMGSDASGHCPSREPSCSLRHRVKRHLWAMMYELLCARAQLYFTHGDCAVATVYSV